MSRFDCTERKSRKCSQSQLYTITLEYGYTVSPSRGTQDCEKKRNLIFGGLMMGKTIEELLRSGEDALEKRDYKTAMVDYKAAADMGSAEAFVCLGDIYIEGFACRRNIDAAMECYKKAADMGNTSGMYGVAVCYWYGYGIEDLGADNAYELYEENSAQALKWFEKAADNGDLDAMLRLAEKYIRHILNESHIWFSQKTDLEKVIFWYNRAIEEAEKSAKSALPIINYRIAEQLLDSDLTEKKELEFLQKCADEALKLGHRKASKLINEIENRDKRLELLRSIKNQVEIDT